MSVYGLVPGFLIVGVKDKRWRMSWLKYECWRKENGFSLYMLWCGGFDGDTRCMGEVGD